ncbi:hypothetical protein [Nocardia thailandica]|uniref:hypothetical protein n=1 Tax=Nocardia thailandica TaxID=257275 RepID=UPI0012FABA94|nr:hypothetical protein [Nocardia thailandica]
MFDPLADINRELAARVGWTWVDDILLHTCGVLSILRSQGPDALTPLRTILHTDHGEKCLGEGHATWSFWRSPAVVPFVPPNPVPPMAAPPTPPPVREFVTPRKNSRRARAKAAAINDSIVYQEQLRAQRAMIRAASLAAAGAAHAAAAAAAANARASAPRWLAEPSGTVTVTDRRVHLTNRMQRFYINFASLDRITLDRPDLTSCRFTDHTGADHQVQLNTPWAPTVFAVAAHNRFPDHPQLVTGQWLPAGFEEKCHFVGKTCPRVR